MRQNRRLLLWLATTMLVAGVLWQSRGALTPFIVGLVVAYFLSPVVARVEMDMPPWLHSAGKARPVAVVMVYLVFLLFVLTVAATLIPPLLNQVAELIDNVPEMYDAARASLLSAVSAYDAWLVRVSDAAELPDEVQAGIQTYLAGPNAERIVGAAVGALRSAVFATVGVVRNTVSWLLAFIIVPFWLVYVLNDSGRLIDGTLALIPRSFRADVEAIRLIVDTVLSAYIRGQLIVAVILGAMATVALMLLGVPYWLLIGFTAGFLGVIPLLGAILGALIGVLAALFVSPTLALYTLVAFIIIQQIDNIFVTPRIQGDSVHMHPALIMVVVVLGQNIMGPVGLVVAVPITAIVRDILYFLYLRVGEEPLSVAEALREIGYPDAVSTVRFRAIAKPA
jgi:predicted PurR-regulated permease PerM